MQLIAWRNVRRFVPLLPLAALLTFALPARSFSNGQAASVVLGQLNFTNGYGPAYRASNFSFFNTQGIAIDQRSGKLFVADAANNRVLRFATADTLRTADLAEAVLGQANFTSDAAASGAGGMSYPTDVEVDLYGRLWVVDSYNSRVLMFDRAAQIASGTPARLVIGQIDFNGTGQATSAGGMARPFGLTIDSDGRLWVADAGNNRVLRYDTPGVAGQTGADAVLGQPSFVPSGAALSASGMSFPQDVAVDDDGRLWVTDSNNNRVLRFDNAATKGNGAAADGVLGQPDFVSKAVARGAGMNGPSYLVLSPGGRLWVADYGNWRALWFNNAAAKPNGAPADGVLGQPNLDTYIVQLPTASTISLATGIAIDKTGAVWVADGYYNRILRFTAAGPELLVRGRRQSIADDDITPSIHDGTYVGAAAVGQATEHSFTIENTGAAPLNLLGATPVLVGGANAGEFAVVAAPPSSIEPGASATLTLRFQPAATGTRSATVTIANDDADEGEFTFAVSARGGTEALFMPVAQGD